MRVKGIITYQYDDGFFIRYNQIKYKTICIVLDFFALFNGMCGGTSIARDKIEDMIYASIYKNKKNKKIVDNSLAAMEAMGLVIEKGINIEIQQAGVDAYKNQVFHQIAASLTEAKRSRLLAKYSVIISIIALLISIIKC